MDARTPRLRLLRGGKPTAAPPAPRSGRAALELIQGGQASDRASLEAAVQAARALRREIEQRIARALDGVDPV